MGGDGRLSACTCVLATVLAAAHHTTPHGARRLAGQGNWHVISRSTVFPMLSPLSKPPPAPQSSPSLTVHDAWQDKAPGRTG